MKLKIFLTVLFCLAIANSLAKAQTTTTTLTQGSVLFMGPTDISENNSGLYWDNVNQRLGIGTNTPSAALSFGTNQGIKLSTDQSTFNVKGLIQLQSLTDEAKATIAYLDKAGKEVIWLQAHDYLTYPTNEHKHFSIEASDSKGLKQTRLGVGYGADVVDVTVNQANLIVNRNGGMTNGNIVMSGAGGGGVLKHANSFSFYPNFSTNNTYALQLGLQNGSDLTLRALGSNYINIDDSLKTTGNVGIGIIPTASLQIKPGTSAPNTAPIKLTGGSLLTTPENGAIEYDNSNLYFTVGSKRQQLIEQGSYINRTPVADTDYTVLTTDQLIAFTNLTAARTITLPAATTMNGRVITIKDETGTAATNNIIISGTIDGSDVNKIDRSYGSLEIYSNGTAWFAK